MAMHPFRKIPLHRKLMLIIMLTSVTTLLMAATADVVMDLAGFRADMVRDLGTYAKILGNNSTAALAFGDVKAASEVLSALKDEPHVMGACIYTPGDQPFARYSRDAGQGEFIPPPVRARGSYFEPDRLLYFHDIKLGDETIGILVIVSDLRQMREWLPVFASIVGMVLAASSLLAYLIGSRLQRVISEPVLELVETTKLISNQNNYTFRATKSTDDELGLLVDGFNGMLDQIQRRDQELERQQGELQGEVETRTAMNLRLEAAKEMAEAASRAKGEFLANMSHEIRTPINGVLGMIELSLDTELTQEQRDYLLMAKSSGESLLGIINDILDFSKVESGRLELERIEFNLYASVGETLKALALRAQQKGLELAYDVDPEVPNRVLGDPGRLRQVLVNLVGNAIKFTEQGEVLVEIGRKSREGMQVELHFKISDTGIGIPSDKRNLLFQAFTQADSSTTRKYGGTGLGLAICAGLVNMMGGEIWMESQEGKGSAFHFTAYFSLTDMRVQESDSTAAEAVLRDVRVLIVDDNQTNRRILAGMTAAWGMVPTMVDSGPMALAAIDSARQEGHAFRVILLDGCMPGMDGFQFAESVRRAPDPSGAMILMLTSAGQPGEAARCRELGIAAYLLKPVLKADLRNAILTVLGAESAGEAAGPTLVTRHTLRESPRPLHVLVAEDNEINQTLIVRLLAKMGHSCVVATDGKKALSLANNQSFDLILMDVQMPLMDGLAATAAIREQEKTTGSHIPIFAITARAMSGDNELCLRAGMDGYIPKPVRFSDIERALSSVASMSPAPIRIPPRQPAWGQAEALDRLGGDQNLLHELCRIFLEESPKLLQKLKQAVADADPEALKRAAHSLKGEVSYLSAEKLSHSAKLLEKMGEDKDLSGASELLSVLEGELRDLHSAMRQEVGAAQ